MLKKQTVLSGHIEDRVWHASWSPCGKYLATSGEDKSIRIWDVGKAECISTLEEAQSRTIRCCEWSPNGNYMASASFDGTVVIWEAKDSTFRSWDLCTSLEGHENEVKSVAWSCNGKWLASCGRDKKVWIWEQMDGNEFECVAMLEGHSQDVKCVRWHPTSSVLLSTSYDDSIKIWAEDGGDWYCYETLAGHSSTVWSCTFDFSGRSIVSCSDDRSLMLWQSDSSHGLGSWNRIQTVKSIHDYTIYSVDWNASNGFICSAGADNSIVLCSRAENEDILVEANRIVAAHAGDINCVRWNPNESFSDLLCSTGDDGLVNIWQVQL